MLQSLDLLAAEIDEQLTKLTIAASPSAQTDLRRRAEVELNFPATRLSAPIPATLTES
ncbi:MAG TPA: hypothetical protein VH392_02325 [Sphingomicrobium sp.]|jgi:hypothetical protein